MELKRLLRHAYRLPPHAKRRGRRHRRSGRADDSGGQEWTMAEIRLLGKVTDQELARATCRTVEAVAAKRRKLGVRCPTDRTWTREQLSLVGKFSDSEVAARTGHPFWGVAAKRRQLGLVNPGRKRRP